MIQLTTVGAVETALTDLCQNDIRMELAEMPQCKGRYVVKKGQKHFYVICESTLSKLSLLVKSIVLYLLT